MTSPQVQTKQGTTLVIDKERWAPNTERGRQVLRCPHRQPCHQ
jgi:hypothetical protein